MPELLILVSILVAGPAMVYLTYIKLNRKTYKENAELNIIKTTWSNDSEFNADAVFDNLNNAEERYGISIYTNMRNYIQ